MMRLTLEINDEVSEAWAIRNVGHPETGDHPEDDDLRLYEVSGPDGHYEVVHRRSDGRHALAAKVLAESPGCPFELFRSGEIASRPRPLRTSHWRDAEGNWWCQAPHGLPQRLITLSELEAHLRG